MVAARSSCGEALKPDACDRDQIGEPHEHRRGEQDRDVHEGAFDAGSPVEALEAQTQ